MHESIRIVICFFAVTFFAASLFLGCSEHRPKAAKGDSNEQFGRIAVTNFPLYCFANRLCEDSDSVKEVVYVGPGQGDDPHAWMPTADQIRDLQNVDLIVCNGPGAVFANWMEKVTVDDGKLCKTTDAIKLTEFVLVEDFQLVHSHGPEGEHSHTWVVPQSWLSPSIARKQATYCYKQLTSRYGQSKAMENSFAELQKEFDQLESLHEKLKLKSNAMTVATSTPDLQYMTRSLDWKDRYLHWNETREVDQARKEVSEMRDRYRARVGEESGFNEAKLFLWSGKKWDQLSPFVSESWQNECLIDLIDTPVGNAEQSEEYFSRMKSNLNLLSSFIE